MFIYRKDKSKFIWLIIALILTLGIGTYGAVYACETDTECERIDYRGQL